METIAQLLKKLTSRLGELARGNAVVARKVSVGERHVIPLCELSLGFGGGGGEGEGTDSDSDSGEGSGKGTAAGAGGSAKASPVAVIVVEHGRVRVETLGQ